MKHIFVAYLVCCSVFSPSMINCMEAAKELAEEPSAQELICLWLKDKNIETISTLILKYFQEAVEPSVEKGLHWCREALASDFAQKNGIEEFKKRGIVKIVQELADQNNPHACYIMSGFLYAQARQDQIVSAASLHNYLQRARHVEPLAYPLLLDLVSYPKINSLAEEIQGKLDTFVPALRQHLLREIKRRYENLWEDNKPSVLSSLLRWYMIAQEPCESFEKIFLLINKRKLYSEFSQISRDVYEYLKKSSQDASCSYQIGMLYLNASLECTDKASKRENKDKALGFWRMGQRKKHIPSSWMLIACDQASGLEQFRTIIELTRQAGNEKKLDELSKSAVAQAVDLYALNAETFEQLQAVGDLYTTGILNVIKKSPSKAIYCYKSAYRKAYAALCLKEESSSIILFIVNCLVTLGSSEHTKSAQAALISMLDECSLENISLPEAVALTKLYVSNITNNIQPSAPKLILVLEAVHKKFTDKATLKKFMAETALTKLLQSTDHPAAHYFILATRFALSKEPTPKEIATNIQQTEQLEKQFRKKSPHLIQTLGLLDHSRNYARETHSLKCALFFACCALERIGNDQWNLANQGNILQPLFEGLAKLLEERIVDHAPPFMSEDLCADRFKLQLRAFTEKRNFLAKLAQSNLHQLIKRVYGLTCLLVNSDFMTESFQRGVRVLGTPYDEENNRLLTLFCLMHKPSAQSFSINPRKKLETYFGLSLAALYAPKQTNARTIMLELIEYTRSNNHAILYKELSERCDPLAYESMLFNDQSASDTKMMAHLFYIAHCTLMAEASSNNERLAYQAKADEYLVRGLKVNAALMNILLGSEYITGRLFLKDVQKGKNSIIEGVKAVDIRNLSTAEFTELSNTMQAVLEKIRESSGDQELAEEIGQLAQIKVNIETLWKDFQRQRI